MQRLKLFVKNLNANLEGSLLEIQKETGLIRKLQLKTECYYEVILQLKSFIQNHSFIDLEEEINFFKVIKPGFTSEYLLYKQSLHTLIKMPIGNKSVQINYYEQKLKEITYFFHTNQEFYQYFRLNSTHLDTLYFVRQNKELMHFADAGCINFDPAFSSSHDHILAQLMANDRLEVFLKDQISEISGLSKTPHVEDQRYFPNYDFKWTENKSALIELIYALYYTGCINHGKCDIIKLSSFFEKAFNVQLTDIYRGFQDIKSRNIQTKFLDNLKNTLQKRIDEEYQ